MSKQPSFEQLDQAIDAMFSHPDAVAQPLDQEVGTLLSIAGDLCALPRSSFKANLKAELERKAIMMSTETAVSPAVIRTITPYLLPDNLEFLDFLKRAFNAEETFRAEAGPGRAHAEVKIGDSMLMVGVGAERKMPATLELYVPNVDEVYDRAIKAGCTVLDAVEDAHWEPLRLGSVKDPAGNSWVIATRLQGSYIPEGRHSITMSFVVKGGSRFVEFLKQAYDAEEIRRHEWPTGLYASLKIGDSVVGVSESENHAWMQPQTALINMRVPNCDEQYARALRAGAKALTPVENQPYGVRAGAVEDLWGNQWYITTPL